MSTPPESIDPPIVFRSAGVLVALQGAVSFIVGVVLLMRAVSGAGDNSVANGYGTAGWFLVLGVGVGAAGIALVLGKRWGRAIATVVQLLLLPVVWSLLTGSHQTLYGLVLGIVVLAALAMLFSPSSSQWMAAEYTEAEDDDYR